jgi:hypothetical protein
LLEYLPDTVVFDSGVPIILFEFKFTQIAQPTNSHLVHVGTYGQLLQNMGCDTERLFHAIVLVNPKLRNGPTLREKTVHTVVENGPKEAVLETEKAKIFISKFSQNQSQRDLDWAIQYWQLQREAVPTENQNKCEKCISQQVQRRDNSVGWLNYITIGGRVEG